jgi:nucleotide-binding universal stress UspA family protein
MAADRTPIATPAAEDLARRFHETYERLAPQHGYETREASAKPWEQVPDTNKRLMVAVCAELLTAAGAWEPEYLVVCGDHVDEVLRLDAGETVDDLLAMALSAGERIAWRPVWRGELEELLDA